jgi:hypothetical protein
MLYGKVIRDEESRAMLEIIYGNSVYDFGLNFSNFNDLVYIIPRIMQTRSTDVVSFYERRENNVQQNLDRVYEAYLRYLDD